MTLTFRSSLVFLLLMPTMAFGQAKTPAAAAKESASLPGHSMHGEVFNEGPRQKAYLMGGTGKCHFPISTTNPEVQALFDQGIGQLHGFWYFEAERTFRQAAVLDPDCPLIYWGMAMANVNNQKRAKGFIDKAVARKQRAGRNEQLWIDAYAGFFQSDRKDDKQRRRDLVKRLEDLIYEFPNDLEAKAFLAYHIWDNGSRGWPNPSLLVFDSLVQQVLDAEPMHPAHHYRIHLWDYEKPARALKSAALCGQSAPNIAHMWHMPGHTYSHVQRYADAVYQQEASARVDHKHMMHDRVLPDQIHNYAHNNQWLVENLGYIGRVHDAIDLAKNMIELPRHPRYNTYSLKEDGSPYSRNFGSSSQGRNRLFEVLVNYELWDEIITLSDTIYLEPTDLVNEQIKRLRILGVAYYSKGAREKGQQQVVVLEQMRAARLDERRAEALKAESKARGENLSEDKIAKAMNDAYMKNPNRIAPIDDALAELRAYDALATGEKEKAKKLFDQVKGIGPDRQARLALQLGDKERAIKLAKEHADRGPNQVLRLANYIDILHCAGKPDAAREPFQQLCSLSGQIDIDVPVMKRLAPAAKAANLPADWRVPMIYATDVGNRPNLRDLGPFRWQPSPAPNWSLASSKNQRISLGDYRGKSLVVIFYLGYGCAHCIEQLEAFAPMTKQFGTAGISLVAISNNSVEDLKKTFEKTKSAIDFPLLSDQTLSVFRAYRAYDDFEKQALHGTFLIDADGLVRWQDISFEPFKDAKFLLAEAKRLLSVPRVNVNTRTVRAD